MGWNEVAQARPHALWAGIPDRSRFYFVHSYYPAPRDAALTAATTVYGAPLPARSPGIIFLLSSSTPEKPVRRPATPLQLRAVACLSASGLSEWYRAGAHHPCN